jgi:hypothetical protein
MAGGKFTLYGIKIIHWRCYLQMCGPTIELGEQIRYFETNTVFWKPLEEPRQTCILIQVPPNNGSCSHREVQIQSQREIGQRYTNFSILLPFTQVLPEACQKGSPEESKHKAQLPSSQSTEKEQNQKQMVKSQSTEYRAWADREREMGTEGTIYVGFHVESRLGLSSLCSQFTGLWW